MKRILVLMLCTALIFANLKVLPLMAEDNEAATGEEYSTEGYEEGDQVDGNDNQINDGQENGGPEEGYDQGEEGTPKDGDVPEEEGTTEGSEAPEEIRKIVISPEKISFGTLIQDAGVSPQGFSITNEGNVPVNLKWTQTDPNEIFNLEVLSESYDSIEPGESLECLLTLKEGSLAPGDYSATFTFEDEEDPENQVSLPVTVRIEQKETPKEPEKENDTDEGTPQEPEKQDPPKENPSTEVKPQEKSTQKTEKDSYYTVKVACSPKEGGYASGGGTFAKGSKTVLTEYKNAGFSFKGWYLNGKQVSTKESYPVKNITANMKYTAEFERNSYRIKVRSANENYGTVSGGGDYKGGETATIKAYPEDGYVFGGWYEDDTLVSKKQTYKVKSIDDDHSFKAVFRSETHLVDANVYPYDAGEVIGAGRYEDGSDVYIKAEPKEGYVFKAFFVNNQILTIKDSYTFKNVTRDMSITAYFEKEDSKTHSIVSGVANKGGVISPSGNLTISEHASITYTIAPDNGYAIQEVALDGKKLGPVETVTLSDITEDHTIAVAFAPKEGNVNGVSKDKIISTKEAEKVAVADLMPASNTEDSRISGIITPEMYEKLKEEGNLDDAFRINPQSIVGMDGVDDLPDTAGGYNYDKAKGLYQILDISPDQAGKLIDEGEDDELLKKAYETGMLEILVNNHYLVPGKEEKVTDAFEDNDTIENVMEFVSGALTKEEKLGMCEGIRVALNVGITEGTDLDEEDKAMLEKAGATIDECFYMTVMKQVGDQEPENLTELQRPIEIVLEKPEGSAANCVVRLHNGHAEILDDIDDDPETITIKTDRFSPYAFAEKEDKGIPFIPVAVGIVAAAAVLAAIIAVKRRKEE